MFLRPNSSESINNLVPSLVLSFNTAISNPSDSSDEIKSSVKFSMELTVLINNVETAQHTRS
jgi:hypothetical protein